MGKLTFNKLSVILMYVMIIVVPIVCIIIQDYPPDALIYCWFGFWTVQAVITAKLRMSKRSKEQSDKLLDNLARYFTEDNIADVSEKLIGVDLHPKKKKSK